MFLSPPQRTQTCGKLGKWSAQACSTGPVRPGQEEARVILLFTSPLEIATITQAVGGCEVWLSLSF